MTPLGDMLTPAYRMVGEGPETVFFLHGIGGGRTSFDAQIGALGPRYRHLAWDMPGYGGSSPLPEMTFPALAQAAIRLLDALHVERAHIVGHSMGGMVAQELAIDHGERVVSLVLSATSPAFGKPGGDWQRAFLAARLAPLDAGKTPADLAPAVVAGLVTEDAPATAVDAAVASMSDISSDAYRAALTCLVTFDRRASLDRITTPCLLLAGDADSVAPAPVMARMAEHIADAHFVSLPGAGHLANLETPAAFNAAVADFLASHPIARADDTGPDRQAARAD
ncbi:MAG: alpha/beta hydrolase [Alphaproteobacteria bacterium]|nr:alpha/beta hydrolase [Alphaproteobacteria bacterium]